MPSYLGHVITENRNGLVVQAMATQSSTQAEREAALAMLDKMKRRDGPVTLGADKGYQNETFVEQLRAHRSLCMGSARERERKESGCHHPGCVGEFVLEVVSTPGVELGIGLIDVWAAYIMVPANHRHLQRLGCNRDMP